MNFPTYTTDTLVMDPYQASSVFEMMIHTICFHRMIYKTVKPKGLFHPIYDGIYYIKIDDPVLHRTIMDKIDDVVESIKGRPSGTLSLVFYHVTSTGGWFSKEDKVEMERWNMPFQWYESSNKSHTHVIKEQRIRFVYSALLEKLGTLPAPVYHVINDYLPFDIIDSNKTNSLKDIFQFIINGPPKLGLF